MDAILQFLLPQQPLEYIFLGLLVACIVIALWAGYILRNKILSVGSVNNLSLSASSYSNLLRYPLADNILENIAGFCLIIGLLGTFLGIGMAIQEAGSVLVSINDTTNLDKSLSDTLGKLNPVLSQIGMKFKVSTWGIIASIFIRLVLPFFNIEGLIENLIADKLSAEQAKKLEDEDKYRRDVLRVLGSIVDSNSAIKNNLQEAIKIPESLNKSTHELLVVTKSLEKITENLGQKTEENLKNINSNTESLKTNTDTILKEMNQSIINFNEDMEATLKDFSTLSINASQTLEDTSILAKGLIDNIQTLVDADYMEELVENVEAVNNNTQHLDEMKMKLEDILSTNQTLKTLVEDSNQLNQRIDDSINRNKSDRTIIRMS